jgi:hypothetical protein
MPLLSGYITGPQYGTGRARNAMHRSKLLGPGRIQVPGLQIRSGGRDSAVLIRRDGAPYASSSAGFSLCKRARSAVIDLPPSKAD